MIPNLTLGKFSLRDLTFTADEVDELGSVLVAVRGVFDDVDDGAEPTPFFSSVRIDGYLVRSSRLPPDRAIALAIRDALVRVLTEVVTHEIDERLCLDGVYLSEPHPERGRPCLLGLSKNLRGV